MEQSPAQNVPAAPTKELSEARLRAIEKMKQGKQVYEEKKRGMMTELDSLKREMDELRSKHTAASTTATVVPREKDYDTPSNDDFVRVPKMIWEEKNNALDRLKSKAKQRKEKLYEYEKILLAESKRKQAVLMDDDNESVPQPKRVMSRSVLNETNNEFLELQRARDEPRTFSMSSNRVLSRNALENARAPAGVMKAPSSLRDKISGK